MKNVPAKFIAFKENYSCRFWNLYDNFSGKRIFNTTSNFVHLFFFYIKLHNIEKKIKINIR
jgi:uncharacterized protein (UPF0333 family)